MLYCVPGKLNEEGTVSPSRRALFRKKGRRKKNKRKNKKRKKKKGKCCKRKFFKCVKRCKHHGSRKFKELQSVFINFTIPLYNNNGSLNMLYKLSNTFLDGSGSGSGSDYDERFGSDESKGRFG